jgi:hypothetical protein
VGFVVDKVGLGKVFSEYFGFFCQSLFHQLLHNHHYLSSGAGTIGQTVGAVASGLSLTPTTTTIIIIIIIIIIINNSRYFIESEYFGVYIVKNNCKYKKGPGNAHPALEYFGGSHGGHATIWLSFLHLL